MRLTNIRVLPARLSSSTREREGVDRVVVIVAAIFLALCVVRGLIPAMIDGEPLGMALLATGTALLAVLIALLPAWSAQRNRRSRT